MAKYQIWDKVSKVITPSMEVFEANEWANMYPIAKIDGVKLVISGGMINGAFCGEFTSMVDRYKAMGCNFSGCDTDQDYLDRIEEFENTPVDVNVVTTDERIAAALEAQVLMALPDEEA